jgi:hypothetical protein
MDPLTNKVIKVSIPRSSLDSIPTSFATVSLGKPSDSLLLKLSAISSAGFKGVELGFPDLVSFASEYHKKEIKEDDYDRLCEAGKGVKMICEQSNLKIIMLQPFSNFEGWKKGSKERKEAFERAKGWIRIMQSVGTDMLQVGSSDSPNISTSKEDIVSDIRELADMLAEHKLRLAYENWCWSTHACVIYPLLFPILKNTNTSPGQLGKMYGKSSRRLIDQTSVSVLTLSRLPAANTAIPRRPTASSLTKGSSINLK